MEQSESSSSELIDIQIEQSLVRETLMMIDSANCKEDAFTLAGFLLVLVLSIVIGIFGPPEDVNTEIGNNLGYQIDTLEVPFSRIKSSMRTFKIDVFFAIHEYEPWFDSKASLVCTVIKYQNDVEIGREVKRIRNRKVIFGENDHESQVFRIMFDKVIDYDSVMLKISDIEVDDRITQLFVRYNNGTESHTLFQIYLRSIFTFFCAVLMILFIMKLKSTKINLWHLEQKLTLPLIILTILFNNPIFSIYAFFPTSVYVYWDIFIKAVLLSYFNTFILIVFSSLNKRIKRTGLRFFMPRIALGVFQFFIRLMKDIITEVSYSDLSRDNMPVQQLETADFIMSCIFMFYIVLQVIISIMNVDIIERYKLAIYLISYITLMTAVSVAHFIATNCKIGMETSVEFTTNYSVINVFAMLMIYFHWPYELLNDQVYDESSTSNHVQTDFFVANE